MKNFIFLMFVTLVFVSCSRCKTCTLDGYGVPLEVEVCREDYDSGKKYRKAIEDLEDSDWECK